MKKELNKKSEAIFIIVLISFLLYKLIDFVISLDSSKNTDWKQDFVWIIIKFLSDDQY